MIYPLCLSVQPGLLQLENPKKWEGGQVYDQFPKTSGFVGIEIANVMFRAMLGNNAPNVSVVSGPLTGSAGKDGSPTGYCGSLHNNESDITFSWNQRLILGCLVNLRACNTRRESLPGRGLRIT